jgi:hypothetical protein
MPAGRLWAARRSRDSQLTIAIRPMSAKIDLGKTLPPPNWGRIAPLTLRR